MRPEQRGWAKRLSSTSNWQQEETLAATKPFDIPKLWVAKAFQAVKANGGAAGVDGVSLEVFERSLEDNLYKLWNRMASGSYVPPPGQSGDHPEEGWRGARARGPDGGGPCGADGSQDGFRAERRAGLSGRLVWLQAGQVGAGCRAGYPRAVLEIQLGLGVRHQRSL